MTQKEQTQKAKKFSQYWTDKGDEKQHTQQFWNDLLQNVLDINDIVQYIEFEKPVELKHTSFIDAYIPSCKVLIEQKSAGISLHKKYCHFRGLAHDSGICACKGDPETSSG